MMELWTSPTPNGWKVTIMLEELIEAGVDIGEVDVRVIDLMKGEQFEDDFVERNPNQKIPTLRDDGRDIIESCAILQYLGEKHPTDLLPLDERKWDVMPWVYWQAANVGPVFGNKLSYTRYMDDVPGELKQHPLERFPCMQVLLASDDDVARNQDLAYQSLVLGKLAGVALHEFALPDGCGHLQSRQICWPLGQTHSRQARCNRPG